MMDTFNGIPIFVAVADNAGFSSAARILGISTSAVSKRITQLEDQLGARLFHRTTRKLSLTEAGERYYQYAALANRAAKQAEDAVGELQGEPKGLLKIHLPMTIGQMYIAPLIPEFLARHPGIEIDLVLGDNPTNLVEQGYDLAIRAGDMPDSSLIARRLEPLHSVVCVSPSFYKAHKEQLKKPAQLAKINCIIYSYSSNADVWQFQSAQGEDYKVKVTGNYRVNNSVALRDAVTAGLGAGRLPKIIVKSAIEHGELVALFEDYQMPHKNLYAVYPERNYLPEKVRVFLDFIVDTLNDR
ncbi:LysR substrate-binding domain-containing protein [Enterovibrio sp. ZSDZ35]|uniref:LysR substrate-binding domain-containing protein n=1 Tax=Enterovibrio qingdaonensis TaxID=2899818 RepID=A0ABT5QFK0_9GAMM|nr:LysR family transcriptional regulator [Enterovibrio sp. ZSDZ35]MDD1779753.1 LysR substrate-binding domain-containing protein [Enterovibrio sp. ZSDZ35]